MWCDVNEASEFFKGILPLYMFVILPIFIFMTPVECAHEFSVYRMQQFDLHGSHYGSRNSLVSLEARTADAGSLTRKCVVVRWSELSESLWAELHDQNAGSLLVLLPQNFSDLDIGTTEMLAAEETLMREETPLAVYFAHETPEVTHIYDEIKMSSAGGAESSATSALLAAVYTSGYQLQVAAGNSKAMADAQIGSVMGKLPGYGIEDQLPTITIVAHYDTFGVAPELSFGSDSNGSGVAMLLEILRLLSDLSASSKEQPRANVLFLLSGGGKLNFQGSKRWLEDQLEGLDAGSLQDSDFTLCLDTVGSGDSLFVHVSKPPKDGSPGALFFNNLKSISEALYPELEVKQVHKKINLNTDFLAWEHERFSIRRLPAFTVSHLENPRSAWRKSIFDTMDNPGGLDVNKLARNTRVIAEALARHLYGLKGSEFAFTGDRKVETENLKSWVEYLSKYPRSPQLLVSSTAKNQPSIVAALEEAVARYSSESRLIMSKPDKRDPDFVLYDVTKSVMTAYSVKPALFDLFLSMGIALYLCGVYLVVKNFHVVFSAMEAVSFSSGKAKAS